MTIHHSYRSLLKATLLVLALLPFAASNALATSSNKKDEPVEVLKGFDHLSKESAQCVSCHREKTPGIYQMWGDSKHYRANVGCYECHGLTRLTRTQSNTKTTSYQSSCRRKIAAAVIKRSGRI